MRRLLVGSAVVLAALLGVPGVASAAPPEPSAASASAVSVAPGDVLSVSVELYNPEDFTVTSAAAALRIVELPITSVLELQSCSGAVSCSAFSLTSFRGGVGDLPAGGVATVTFDFLVLEGAPAGSYTFEHQFVGANFAFGSGFGPALDVVAGSSSADLAVSLDASPRGVLTSRITYTVTVANSGPSAASGVRVQGSFAAGLSWGGGSGCVREGTRGLVCDFAAVPVGGSVSASFSVNAGLLTLGSFPASVTRVASSPADPESGNDSARRSCTALTGLLVRC